MAEVTTYANELKALGQSWDLLTVLGQMSGGNTDMTTTREGFRKLTGDLIDELGTETLRIVVKDITSKAKGIIGILTRNLFERTADIGFLATDATVRATLLAHHARAGGIDDEDNRASEILRNKLVKRFEDYVAKYSVYSNIVLLDTAGHVVAQLDDSNQITHSRDALLNQALTTDKTYVESFAESDLFPGAGKVLVYAYRVTDPDRHARALGVLCLCFRFHDELQSIFARLIRPDDWSVLSLLDQNGRVVASSDPYQLPQGLAVDMAINEEYKVARLGSQRYIIKTIPAQPYQGYYGLGWYGHVMVPLHCAFENREDAAWNRLDPRVLASLLESSEIFPEQIRFIPRQADMIQANLDRTVWNGNILSNSEDNRSFKVLLREISNTGARTKAVFSKAITNLQRKVMTCHLNEVGFLAATAIDIMDRNLYERANDCRWWALTDEFRVLLARRSVTGDEQEQLGRTLQHLNTLYTVYAILLLHDKNGRIIATSRPAARDLIGQTIDAEWVKRTLALRNTQHYTVSAFEESPFYEARHTYVFSAAIYSDEGSSQAIGGIAIVFDSEPQFSAMLQDCLPRDVDGNTVADAFGVFVDAGKRVIACSDQRLRPGDVLDVELDITQLHSDTSSRVVTLNGRHYAVGIKASTGYREFKSEADCYSADTWALVFMDLGSATTITRRRTVERDERAPSRVNNKTDGVEIATFSISQRSFGIRTVNIVEALEYSKLAPIPNSPPGVLGSMSYKGKPVLVLNPRHLLGCTPDMQAANLQVVLINTGMGMAGLVVEQLGEICRVDPAKFQREGFAESHNDSCIESIVALDDNDDAPLLVLLNPDKLVSGLMPG